MTSSKELSSKNVGNGAVLTSQSLHCVVSFLYPGATANTSQNHSGAFLIMAQWAGNCLRSQGVSQVTGLC